VAAQYQINGIRRRLRCDHCDNRGLWLLVRTRNGGGKARQRPRGGGIRHLADVLDNDADFAAVEALVKPLVSSRKNPVNLAKVLPNITVPTDVRVYKADESQVYGHNAKYLMFTEEQPPAAADRRGSLPPSVAEWGGSRPLAAEA